MSRNLTVLLAAVLIAGVLGCEKSKLRDDMMGDSTWESSAGEEKWEAADQPPKRNDKWEEENEPMNGAPPTDEPKPESSLEQSYPRVSTGVISRDELLPVLDGGLGRFLQNVETEPAFHKGSFVGFRIVSLFPGEPAFASLDLRPGDTVTRINGKSIERPEQAAAVWEDLRTASNLVVDYRRGAEEHALRFTIVDES
ncbi:MAG: serine protease [Deltaproteobacteria bacterium]|nr:serine protease [Deltaproteobacteria bacterium]MBW2212068.1 serine protease [Deltaproteobacteria bacterium]MBW2588329.1 serine protease [Deltaproteobacteria bacterium]MBW2687862.1 serine protease [Deltaproteobacteria bacterium]